MLEWTYNPWRDAAPRRHPALALALELAIAAVAGYSFGQPDVGEMLRWGGLGAVFLLGATASAFLPVRYRLDESGVTVWFLGVPSSRPWSHYRNFYVHDTGVHLTTMPQPSALDPFRGHLLLFAGNRDAVVELVRGRLGGQTAAPLAASDRLDA